MDIPAVAPSILAVPRARPYQGARATTTHSVDRCRRLDLCKRPEYSRVDRHYWLAADLGAILDALRSDEATVNATFEDVLYILEELEVTRSEQSRAAQVLRKFLGPTSLISRYS
jgi:hypothetical protein